MTRDFWFYYFLIPFIFGAIILTIPSFYHNTINQPIFEDAVSFCKNKPNEDVYATEYGTIQDMCFANYMGEPKDYEYIYLIIGKLCLLSGIPLFVYLIFNLIKSVNYKRLLLFLFVAFSFTILAIIFSNKANATSLGLTAKEFVNNHLMINFKMYEYRDENEEWTERFYQLTPIVEYDDDEDIRVCGAKVLVSEPSGHTIIYKFYTSSVRQKLRHIVELYSQIANLLDKDIDDYEYFEQKMYGLEVIKNNQLLTKLYRPKDTANDIDFIFETPHDFIADKGKFYEEILLGGYDINTFFFPELSRRIPISENHGYRVYAQDLMRFCVYELLRTNAKRKKPKGEVFEEAYHRTG